MNGGLPTAQAHGVGEKCKDCLVIVVTINEIHFKWILSVINIHVFSIPMQNGGLHIPCESNGRMLQQVGDEKTTAYNF